MIFDQAIDATGENIGKRHFWLSILRMARTKLPGNDRSCRSAKSSVECSSLPNVRANQDRLSP